jgi:hypothetical protein
MANTLAEARDAVLGVVRTAWIAAAPTAPLIYDNLDTSAPVVPTTFARATIRWVGSSRAALGPSGTWRREGLVFVQIFVPHGSGVSALDPLAEALTNALESPGAIGNVWFRDAGPTDIGSDGVYHQMNVVAQFQFDHTV